MLLMQPAQESVMCGASTQQGKPYSSNRESMEVSLRMGDSLFLTHQDTFRLALLERLFNSHSVVPSTSKQVASVD